MKLFTCYTSIMVMVLGGAVILHAGLEGAEGATGILGGEGEAGLEGIVWSNG
ncbi:hypothetical protein [Anabaena azotica]|uniref:Uncharacterized protein n=1 Tax=Anabaena azotica FACHB-119 TaxID=947527 RepID=A0ABR8DFE2_9NOST|nr:hypothetical protein [Anabaena azotica]MBD2505243.1 hypothetical protein [Anabaena azotica FACHB-119]